MTSEQMELIKQLAAQRRSRINPTEGSMPVLAELVLELKARLDALEVRVMENAAEISRARRVKEAKK